MDMISIWFEAISRNISKNIEQHNKKVQTIRFRRKFYRRYLNFFKNFPITRTTHIKITRRNTSRTI